MFSVSRIAITLGLVSLFSACSNDIDKAEQVQSEPTAYTPITFPDIYSDYLNRDVRDDIFYFVMPDRFYNGDPQNDNGGDTLPISQGGYVIDSKFGFHGGDLKGLEKKLDYLKDLGISAIWMTPILRNKAIQWGGYAHHGYWIVDFTEIDPHFGGNDDLKSLIDAAHAKGIKIFFDIITNHTADVIRYEECHNPDGSFKGEQTCEYKTLEQVASGDKYTPFIPAGDEQVKVPEWLNDPQYYNNQGDSFWQGESAVNGDFVGLDDLNTLHPKVISGMINIYKNIITEFKPDGFRIDTVKHVDMPFWSAFSPAIMEHARKEGIPNFHIFGEVYSGDPLVLSSYTTEGKMPSVLDFGFQNAAADVFYRDKSPELIGQLFDNDDYYTDHDSQADLLMNFLGNHDMGRAGFFINDGMGEISDAEKLQRAILSHAFMYLARGIPVIYYGDEQGFTGDGGDVEAREDLFASKVAEYNDNDLIGTTATTAEENFDQTHPLYLALSQLAELRMQHQTLRRGISFNRYYDPENKVFALSRVDKQEKVEYLVAINNNTSAQTIVLDATSDNYTHIAGAKAFSVDNGKVTLSLPSLSYALLKATTPIANPELLDIQFNQVDVKDGRVRFNFNVATKADMPINLLSVKAEYRNPDGEYVLLSEDFTPPYSSILLDSQFAQISEYPVRVTLSDWQGNALHKVFKISGQNQVEAFDE